MALRSRIPVIIEELQPKIAAALQVAGDLIEAKAKDRVPVNTGRLRDAIHTEYEVKGATVRAYVVAGNNVAWYGHIVEHGGKNAPPHPFLVPAAEESRGLIDSDVSQVLHGL